MAVNIVTGLTGKSHVTSAQDGRKNAFAFGTGRYVFDSGSKFAYELVSNNLIKILDGDLIDQGRHICTEPNDYTELTIDNGISGNNRKDLIVVRYQKNEDTSIESASLAVIKGTSTSDHASDPVYVAGDIINGDLVDEFPLYRVNITGLSVTSVDTLFEMLPIGGIHGVLSQVNQLGHDLTIHNHDERYYTETEMDQKLTDLNKNLGVGISSVNNGVEKLQHVVNENTKNIAANTKSIVNNKSYIENVDSKLGDLRSDVSSEIKSVKITCNNLSDTTADLRNRLTAVEKIYVGQCSLAYSLEKQSGKAWTFSHNSVLSTLGLAGKYIIGVIGTNSGNGWVNVQEADITADGTFVIKLFNNATVTKEATANIKLLISNNPRSVKTGTIS